MNKAAIIKIAGLIIVPFILLLLGIFFLYPWIQSDKYEDLAERTQAEIQAELLGGPGSAFSDSSFATADSTLGDSLTVTADSMAVDSLNPGSLDSLGVTPIVKGPAFTIDSLETVISGLNKRLDSLSTANRELSKITSLYSEDFQDRVKSLLNLEKDELSPILARMSSDQLIRMYKGGSSMQREKILRALDAEKAAKLITEVL